MSTKIQLIGKIAPQPDWNQEDSTRADYIKNKPDLTDHVHPLATIGVNTDLSNISITCTSYDGSTDPTTTTSYYDSDLDEYVFPNDQYYSDFYIFDAGDTVSLQFIGSNFTLSVNGVDTHCTSGTYTMPETTLTKPIHVYTEFGHVVNVKILSAAVDTNGFMSVEDKVLLKNLESSLGDIDVALDAILAMQDAVIGGKTA